MSLKAHELLCMLPGNSRLRIGNASYRIESLSERKDAVAETAGTPCTFDVPSPDVEIEMLDQHGIKGIHIYCK